MNLSSSSHFIQVISISLLILLSLTNCSQPESEIPEHLKELENLVVIQPSSEPTFSIEFTREAVIDDANVTKTWFKDMTSGGFPFGGADWFAGLETEETGRIYIGHRLTNTIQIFDSTGRYLTSVGGDGNGPGEFNGITEIRIQSDQLYAFDFLQFRTTFFSLDPLKVDEVKKAYLSRAPDVEELTGWLYNGNWLINDEKYLVRYMDEYANANVGTPKYNLNKPRPGRYYIVNSEGQVESNMLFELKSQKIITADVGGRHLWNLAPVPFLNQPLVSISDDGHIASANSEEPLIKMYAPKGDYLRAFYLPIEKKTIVSEELIELYGEGDKENENLLENAELPEKWPALGDLIVDDENRLWIATISDTENLTHDWWVLKDTGEFLAKFRWPGNRSIEKVKGGYLYARETDESTGLQTIVKYRVEMNE